MNLTLVFRYSIIVILIIAALYLVWLILAERKRARKISSGGPLR
jgi:hypothetical protein